MPAKEPSNSKTARAEPRPKAESSQPRRPWRTYLPVGLATLLIVVAMGYTLHAGRHIAEVHAPLADAAIQIKLEAMSSRLRLEEAVAGNRHEDVTGVWEHLDRSQWYATAMLEGEANPKGADAALEPPELRREIEDVIRKLACFRTMAEQRLAAEDGAAASPEVDQRFDAVVDDLLAQVDRVETCLQAQMLSELRGFRAVQATLLPVCLGLAVLVTIMLGRYDRQRTQALLDLRDSEERYRAIAEDMPVLICRFLPGGEITHVNEAYCRYFDKTHYELIGQSFLTLIEQADREAVMAGIAALTAEAPTQSLEHRVVAPGGEIRVQRWTNRVLCDDHGSAVAYQAVGEDITEHKRAEETLRASEERLELALEGAGLGIWDQNFETGVIVRNDRWAEMLGYTPEEIDGNVISWKDLIHPDDMPAVDKMIQDHESGQTPLFRAEHRMRTKGGTWKWILNWGRITERNGSGKPVRAVGIHIDITERKQAEEAQRRFEYVVSSSTDMLALVDRDFVYLAANEAYLRAFGKTSNELIGQTVPRTVGQEFFDETIRPKAQRCLAGEEVRFQDWFEFPGSERKYMDIAYFPYVDAAGATQGFVMCGRDTTDRKQAERAHDDQRALLNAIIEGTNDAIFVKDLEGRYLLVNSADAKGLGKTAEEIIGTLDADLFPPEVARQIQAFDRGVISTGESISYEQQFDGGDGTARTYHVVKYPRLAPDGHVIGVIGIARDVTDSKRAERTTQEQARLLDLIFQHSLDSIVLLDKDYDFIRVSEVYAKSCQRDASEFPGHGHFEFYPSDLKEEFDEARANKSVYSKMTRPFVFPDHPEWGTTYWDLALVPILDEEGEIELFVFTLKDVTERTRAQEAQARLATAIDQGAETVIVTDAEGIIQYANPAFERSTGYSQEEAVGKSPRILQSGRHDDAFYKALWETIVDGKTWRGHFTNKRKDGELFEEEAVISPIRDTAGRIVNYVAVKRDVTKVMALEAQLRQSQKMEAIGQLAGGVAHDFNNLLTAILGNAELLLEAVLDTTAMTGDEVVRPGLEQIQAAGKQAASLTRQLLAFSRREITRPEVLDPNTVVGDMEEMLRRLIGEHIQFDVTLSAQNRCIYTDPGQIEQVIMNLVVNAADAMPNGGKLDIRIEDADLDEETAAGHPDATHGRHVLLSVVDNGTGMTPDTIERMFEPFFTTKPVGKGTGLGLATVYGTVKQMGGHIKVNSEPGVGSEFAVYVPVVDRKQTEKKPEADPSSSCAGETVLVCEDESMVRDIMCQALRAAGYSVIEADCGRQALEETAAFDGTIDLLISDVIMPGMNGKELADRLAAEYPAMRVLFVSGYAADYLGARGVWSVPAEFLQKPFGPTALLRRVREILDAERVLE